MKKLNKKNIYMILSILILSLTISFVDAFIKPDYFLKVTLKMIAFVALPILYFINNKDEFSDFKKMFTPNKKDFFKTLLFAVSIYFTIVIGYFILRNFIDFSNVTNNLSNNMGINLNNFLYVTLYISFINSFLEEFFYRGYGYITLKKHTSHIFANIFSASLFSLYHVGMMLESFDFPTLILATIGLFCGGLIFNYLNEKNNNIYQSWLVHMFTNFGINTVGFILFIIAK